MQTKAKTENERRRRGPAGVTLRASSEIFHRFNSTLRWIWYNATCFGYHSALPVSTTIYGRLRLLHRPCRLKLGRNCRLGDDVYLATSAYSEIRVGNSVSINLGCVLVAMEGIEIGANTAIAEYVSIRDQEHKHSPESGVRGAGYVTASVKIGANVWIGRGAYIGPGTVIGDNCIIGANSVVRGEFPANVLVAGSPAKIKKVLYVAEQNET